jgi:prepilin-type N-terminal cleavage/methylation domain-containing protein
MLNKKIKAFTLAEMLVTLALTSIMVTFSYLGLSQMHKLLFQYSDQNLFITQLNELNKRAAFLFEEANSVQKKSETELVFKTDSAESKIVFHPSYILTIKNNKTDSFRLENKGLKIENEELVIESQISPVKRIEFDIYFGKQKFHLIFIKNYDAYSKFMIETENGSN